MKQPTLSSNILPEILREMAKMALEAVMQAEREAFLAEHGGPKMATTPEIWTPPWAGWKVCGCPETGKAASTPNCGHPTSAAPWTWNG